VVYWCEAIHTAVEPPTADDSTLTTAEWLENKKREENKRNCNEDVTRSKQEYTKERRLALFGDCGQRKHALPQ
jgi:hypothetical protein